MGFDSDRPNDVEHQQCPNCGGSVTQDSNGIWNCDTCEFYYDPSLVCVKEEAK